MLGRDVGMRNQLAFVLLLLLGAAGAAATTAILLADARRLLTPGGGGGGDVAWLVFDVGVSIYAGCQGLGYGVFCALQCQLASAGLQQYRDEPCDACAPPQDEDEPVREGTCGSRLCLLVQADALLGVGSPDYSVCAPCGGGAAVYSV